MRVASASPPSSLSAAHLLTHPRLQLPHHADLRRALQAVAGHASCFTVDVVLRRIRLTFDRAGETTARPPGDCVGFRASGYRGLASPPTVN